MNAFQKIKSCIAAALLLIFAGALIFTPEEFYPYIPILLGISLIVYGVSVLVYYIGMARHMVGGKSFLYEAIIIIDIALFTVSIYSVNNQLIVLFYLLGLYAFTGVIDVLRAIEAKNAGAAGWKMKFSRGIVCLAFVIALFIIGFIVGRSDILIFGYALSLVYSAVMRIITAFKKTAMVYIQ